MARRSALILISAFALCASFVAATARAQSCSSAADCPDGYGCDLPPTAGACDSSSGGCSGARIAPSLGLCEPAKLRCQVDADCPAGLTCDVHSGSDCTATSPAASGSAGDSAGATPPPEQVQCDDQPSEGECVLALTECTKDAQCDAPEVCTALGVTSECSGSGSASPACAPGSECPAPPPPQEEQCTETTRSFCFPQRHDCSGGEKCPADTRCVQLPEDSLDHPPPGWEGVSALCLPEGWALVIEGRVKTGGGGTGSSAEASSSGRDTAKGGQANDSAAGASGGGEENDVVEDNGCAVHTPGSGSGGTWPPVFGLALGLLGLSRRRRAPR